MSRKKIGGLEGIILFDWDWTCWFLGFDFRSTELEVVGV